MKMRPISRISDPSPLRGYGSYGSRLFHLSHIIARFFLPLKSKWNMACICSIVLIGNNGYHGYPSPLAVALVATIKPDATGSVKYQQR
jgi:hypothetical protein